MNLIMNISVCLSGTFEQPRKTVMEKLTSLGVMATDKPTPAVNYLVIGSKPSDAKLKMAHDHDLPIITMSDLLVIIDDPACRDVMPYAHAEKGVKHYAPTVIDLNMPKYRVSIKTTMQIARAHELEISRKSLTSQTVTVSCRYIDQLAKFMFDCGVNINK